MGADASAAVDPRIARTREAVVAATAELLADDGFERVTIEGIAERSGVARSTIYRNWPTKADLLIEAFDQLCAFPDIPDLGSLEDELRLLGAELVRGLSAEAWGRALPSLVGAAAHDPELVEAQRMFSDRRRSVVGAAFTRAADRGEISGGVDVRELAEAFAAGFFFRRLMTHGPLDDALIERQVRTAVAAARAS